MMRASSKYLLRNIVEKFGTDLTRSPALCDAYLSDLMPSYPEERNLLVSAVAEEVPAQLLKNNSAANQRLLVDRFANIYLIPEAEARQVIDAWFFAIRNEYERIHQKNDRHVTRHYLGGVLTGLVFLGVSSAIAVYQAPDGSTPSLKINLYDATQQELAEISIHEVGHKPDVESQMKGVLTLSPHKVVESATTPENAADGPVYQLSVSDEKEKSLADGYPIHVKTSSGSILDVHRDYPHEPDNSIKIQSVIQAVLSEISFAKMKMQAAQKKRGLEEKRVAQNLARKGAEEAVALKITQQKARQKQWQAERGARKKAEADKLRKEAAQVVLKEKIAEEKRLKAEDRRAAKEALVRQKAERLRQMAADAELARKKREQAEKKRVAQNFARKKAEEAAALKIAQQQARQKQLALAAQQKKAQELKRKQAAIALQAKKAGLARQQAARNSKQNIAKVQNIARQLMGNSIAFGQTSAVLRKRQADLGVLNNLLKLTKEDFYQQQQREVNSKISSLRKKQDALSARYIQHLQQLCSLPPASMQAGVGLLSPAYAGRQGVKAVAFRMLQQHTARCNQVKRIQNHVFTRELSLAYGRALTNP